jgi:hypothetical protein
MTVLGENAGEADDRHAFGAYLLCLAVAFGLYLIIYGLSNGWSFFFLCAAVLAGLALAAWPFGRGGTAIAPVTAGAAVVLVLAVPLGGLCAGGVSLPVAIAQTTMWPQILVLLFAGRVLAELSSLRFAAAWRRPLDGGRMATQSMAAAFVTGCTLTLCFYKAVGGIVIAPERLDPWAIVVRALTGQTAIHVAIVLLFFVTIAAIADATLILAGDRIALRALRRLSRARVAEGSHPAGTEIASLVSEQLGRFAHTRTVQFVLTWASQTAAPAEPGRSLDGFHRASRKMVRVLLSFLPLLGFLGTVIGLTAAIGGLPGDLGPDAQGGLDIGASLVGLAVKFETTLLGLAGGLIASLMLALLEKHEDELAAECRHLVEALARQG